MSNNDEKLLEEEIKLSLSKTNKSNESNETNEFIDNLWYLANTSIEPLIYSKCQINIKATISVKEVTMLIDTGASTNVMTLQTAKRLGLESFIDTNCKGKAFGIGANTIIGIIPYVEMNFSGIDVPTNFYIMEDTNNIFEVLIGFPFMLFYKTKLDFENHKMEIMGYKIDLIIREI